MKTFTLLLILFLGFKTLTAQSIYAETDYNTYRNHLAFQKTIDPKNFDIDLLNASIFFATNAIRAENGLSILSYHAALEEAAGIHSQDMAKDNFFSHTNPKNKKHREADDRAIVAGIANPHLAENIIEGFILQYQSNMQVIPVEPGVFRNPETNQLLAAHTYLSLSDALLEGWMNSQGHRENILSDKALELGCGVALYYMDDFNHMPAVKATQNFQWFEKIELLTP